MKFHRSSLRIFLCAALIAGLSAAVVFASSTWTYTESFRENGSVSSSSKSFDSGENLELDSVCKITLDPDTSSTEVTSYAAIKKTTWYGSKAVSSNTKSKSLYNSYDTEKTYTLSNTCVYTVKSDGKYFMYAKTSGASSAFYSSYTLKLSY